MGAVIAEVPEFTAKEVAAHKAKDDCWMTIHGQGEFIYKWLFITLTDKN